MSTTLYALVVLQGTTLNFSPGYTTTAECLQQYRGPYVACFAYDPGLTSWSAFFKLPDGAFRRVYGMPSEDECKRYVAAFKDDVPAACRQLAMPVTCNVACVAPMQPPAPTGSIPPPAKPVPPEPKPDPASLETNPSNIQVGGKRYTRVAGLTWVEREDSFADVSVGPNELQSKDAPWPQRDRPTPLPPKVQTVRATGYVPKQYAQHPEPLKAIIDVVLLPLDFLAYPGRRDW
jgi:hypothetical protein